MPMDKETAEALEESIAHWQTNVAAERPTQASTGAGKCALCMKFMRTTCGPCPVATRTGRQRCQGTPYMRAEEALLDWELGEGTREQWREAAQAELDFLISLREPAE